VAEFGSVSMGILKLITGTSKFKKPEAIFAVSPKFGESLECPDMFTT
jgi:hypothetical protein